MDDISNRTLAILLVAAIAISLGGTLLSLNRLAYIGVPAITGFGSNIGTVDINILSQTVVNFTTAAINWGEITMNNSITSNVGCHLWSASESNTSDELGKMNCSYNLATGLGAASGLILENTGNTNVSINISCSNRNSTFIGGGAGGGAVYAFNVSNVEADACNFYDAVNFSKNSQTYTSCQFFNDGNEGYEICNATAPYRGLKPEDGRDSIKFHFKLFVPNDAGSGAKTSTFTAYASSI